MNPFLIEEVIKMLRAGKCEIEFTKVNGERRTMRCTLNEDLIPKPVATDTDNSIDLPKKEKKSNPEVLTVWCLDKKEWRSFRIANLISAIVPP